MTATAILQEQRARETATLTDKLARLEDQQQLMEARMTSAEAAMLQAARLAAVGELAASIAHEINNPLYAARNSLYLHADDLPALGLSDGDAFTVHDLVSDAEYTWRGSSNFVELDPSTMPAHVFHVRG